MFKKSIFGLLCVVFILLGYVATFPIVLSAALSNDPEIPFEYTFRFYAPLNWVIENSDTVHRSVTRYSDAVSSHGATTMLAWELQRIKLSGELEFQYGCGWSQ